MANKKIKLTRTELKAQRDVLARYERYLPTLKLKQQQLQSSIVQAIQNLRKVEKEHQKAEAMVNTYRNLFRDIAGLNIQQLAQPETVKTNFQSIAGVKVPQFESATFPLPDYSLFGTAPWVDRALHDLKAVNRLGAELQILQQCVNLLQRELKKVMQRVNLFEKIKIPETRDNIRRIRIAVGDQMTAGVARAKIAKAKLEQKEQHAKEAAAL